MSAPQRTPGPAAPGITLQAPGWSEDPASLFARLSAVFEGRPEFVPYQAAGAKFYVLDAANIWRARLDEGDLLQVWCYDPKAAPFWAALRVVLAELLELELPAADKPLSGAELLALARRPDGTSIFTEALSEAGVAPRALPEESATPNDQTLMRRASAEIGEALDYLRWARHGTRKQDLLTQAEAHALAARQVTEDVLRQITRARVELTGAETEAAPAEAGSAS